MREVHVVRPYSDGPIDIFTTYSAAWLRKVEYDRKFGNMATIQTHTVEEAKGSAHNLPVLGPSGVNWDLRRAQRT